MRSGDADAPQNERVLDVKRPEPHFAPADLDRALPDDGAIFLFARRVRQGVRQHLARVPQRRAGLLDLHVARDAVEIQRAHRRQHRERLVRRRHRGARRSRTARLQSHERALFFPSSRVRVGLKHAQSPTGNRFAKKLKSASVPPEISLREP